MEKVRGSSPLLPTIFKWSSFGEMIFTSMKLKKANRPNKHKNKKSSGCGLCKPHKHGDRAMKDKERLNLVSKQKVEMSEADEKYMESIS